MKTILRFYFTGNLFSFVLFRLLTVTPHNRRFRSQQVIVLFDLPAPALRFKNDIAARDCSTTFLNFNKDRVILLYTVMAGPVTQPVLPVSRPVPWKPVL